MSLLMSLSFEKKSKREAISEKQIFHQGKIDLGSLYSRCLSEIFFS